MTRPSRIAEVSTWPALVSDTLSWQTAMQRRLVIPWIRVAGDGSSVTAALDDLGAPLLPVAQIGQALDRSVAESPVVDAIGDIRIVRATVSDPAKPVSPAALTSVRVIASAQWIVTWSAQPSSAMDAIHRDVDLKSRPDGSSGYDLAVRVLLEMAGSLATTISAGVAAMNDESRVDDLPLIESALHAIADSSAELRRHGRPSDTAWFPLEKESSDAAALSELLAETTIRARAAEAEASRREARLRADAERRRTEFFQLILGAIAAILLGPSFVAAGFAAFPGWLPVDHLGGAFLGLCLVSAGLLWLAVYVVPAIATRQLASTWALVTAVTVGAAALICGLVIALPLSGGLDERPPDLVVDCPQEVARGAAASVAVAAADGESGLDPEADPTGLHRIDTTRSGPLTVRYYARDKSGRVAAKACTVLVR
jgi:hypothetical protein